MANPKDEEGDLRTVAKRPIISQGKYMSNSGRPWIDLERLSLQAT